VKIQCEWSTFFVDEIDLGALGFEGVDPAATGRPAHHPGILLKIYIYGYLNRIQSSRRLEREGSRAASPAQCTSNVTTGKERRVKRWEHEAVVDAMQTRLENDPTMMRRRQTDEHPFGTLKYSMGSTHFLTKTLPRVSTDMSLHVMAYNLKRMMNILGISGLLEAIRA
jgi:hypothetical protein